MEQQQNISRAEAADLPVIALPGEIDSANSDQVAQALASAVMSGPPALIADLTRTTFCDSAAARMLYRACRDAAARGAELRIAAHPYVLRVLELMGYDQVLPLYSALDHARAATTPARTGFLS